MLGQLTRLLLLATTRRGVPLEELATLLRLPSWKVFLGRQKISLLQLGQIMRKEFTHAAHPARMA
jgi:hypothetical protein